MPESPPNVLKTYVDDPAAAPLAKLQANAISGAQDVVIGMASSAPAASIGLTIAPLVAATAYGSGAVILLTAVPMLVIANAYRRLNLWNANTGASFEWVGRAWHFRIPTRYHRPSSPSRTRWSTEPALARSTRSRAAAPLPGEVARLR